MDPTAAEKKPLRESGAQRRKRQKANKAKWAEETMVSAQPDDQSLDATTRKLDAELESFVGAPAPKKRPLSTAAGSHSPAKRPTTGAGVQQKSSVIADMESKGYSQEKIAEMLAMGLE